MKKRVAQVVRMHPQATHGSSGQLITFCFERHPLLYTLRSTAGKLSQAPHQAYGKFLSGKFQSFSLQNDP